MLRFSPKLARIPARKRSATSPPDIVSSPGFSRGRSDPAKQPHTRAMHARKEGLTFRQERRWNHKNGKRDGERSAPRDRHVGHLLETGGAKSPRDGHGMETQTHERRREGARRELPVRSARRYLPTPWPLKHEILSCTVMRWVCVVIFIFFMSSWNWRLLHFNSQMEDFRLWWRAKRNSKVLTS